MFRRNFVIGLTLFAGIFWALAASTVAQQEVPQQEKIVSLVKPYLENQKFSGLSVGIVHDGQTYFLNFGSTGNGDQAPTADTIYEIGSMSKVFTGVLLADAVASKSLTLDQTLGSLIPDLAEKNPAVAAITLQQLSNHVSGLPRMPLNIKPDDLEDPFKGYDRKMMTEFLMTCQLLQEPDAKHDYSNLGVGLLGDLLSMHAGKSYEALLKERLLDPLEMTDSSIEVDGDRLPRFAMPHHANGTLAKRWTLDSMVGAGGIRSTTKDMVRFLAANLEPPKSASGEALNLAWEIHLPAEKHRAMGLGWFLAGDGNTRWHNGRTGGYQSMMLVSRKLKTGVVVLCNTAGSEIDPLAEGIFQTLIGMEVKPRSFKATPKIEAAVLDSLAGRYQLAPGAIITVTHQGNGLLVQLTGQPSLPVFPESERIWNYQAVEAKLEFDLPEDKGPASKVTLYQNGLVMPAPRVN